MSNLKPSDILVKTRLVAGITPFNDASNFPSHYADFGYGGLRSTTTIEARDAIPTPRRDEGMIVFVISENKYYRLEAGITNSDWVEFDTGGGLTTLPNFVSSSSSRQVILTKSGQLMTYALTDYREIDTRPNVNTGSLNLLFTTSDWITSGNELLLTLTHNLNSFELTVNFYEDNNSGDLFVPWEYSGLNRIIACIPSGFPFSGRANIVG